MKKQEIIINTVPVTIKVIEVGGKKMTQSVFNQIPNKYFAFLSEEERQSGFIGWIKHNGGKFLLFTYEGILYKNGIVESLYETYKTFLGNDKQIYISI